MLLLAVILLVPAGTAFAGPWGRGMGMGPGYGPGLYATANLSPEQSSQLQALREGHWREIGPLQDALFAKRSEMRMLWDFPPTGCRENSDLTEGHVGSQREGSGKTAPIPFRMSKTPESLSGTFDDPDRHRQEILPSTFNPGKEKHPSPKPQK